jgi:cytochrome c biogenesis protein CcmG, thiol:disulfide interchange protein DsbE
VRRGASVALVISLLGAVLWFGWARRDAFAPADAGSRAPDFTALTLTGEPATLADFRDRVVLLNIWATWCPPCVEEMPSLQRLHDALAPEGFTVVAVSVDAPFGGIGPFGQPGGDVRAFVERLGLEFPVLHDPSGEVQRRYRVPGLPASFLIDREGRIRQRVLGAREWDSPRNTAAIRRIVRERRRARKRGVAC